MMRSGVKGVYPDNLQSTTYRAICCLRRHGCVGAKARFVAVVLTIVGGLACGGGGSPSGRAYYADRFSASSIAFGNQGVGTASSAQTVMVTNTGRLDLAFAGVSLSGANAGDFAKASDTCSGAAIIPDATCTVSVKFTPKATGNRTAALSFTDGINTGPQIVSLGGTGTGPEASLSSSSINFGNQLKGIPSAVQTETVTNSGGSELMISAVTVTGANASDFARGADACTGATIAPAGTCSVSVTFTPSAFGTRAATLNIADNAANSPQAVSLTGTGTAPAATLSAPSLGFGNQILNTASPFQTETVTNSGTASLIVASAIIGGSNAADFAKATDSCTGATIAPSSTCLVGVKFMPSALGGRSATLSISDNASDSPQVASLSGTGTDPVLGLSAPGLSFGDQVINTTSPSQTETITNTGTANLTISSVAVAGANSGDFAKSSDTCTGATVVPTGTCVVNVRVTPSALGSRSASLTFTDNAIGSPQSVTLTAIGVPLANVSPGTITFSGQTVGTTSPAQTATLTNNDSTAINVTTVTITGDFSQTNNCPATLGPGLKCQIQVSSAPTAVGTFYGTLMVGTSIAAAQTVNLIGTGNGPLTGVLTQRYDNGRTGQNTVEVSLTPTNVVPGQFGKLFSLPVDGQVYAQPLYVENVAIPNEAAHNVLYVETEHDSVYAFDADGESTTPLWHIGFLNAAAGVTTVPSADVSSTDISPEIGITSTPVIDPTAGTIYVTAKTKEAQDPSCTSGCTYNYVYRLHALDISTGAERTGSPVVIAASVPGTGYTGMGTVVTFSALRQLQRPGLLLLNGIVYLGFGSHGDVPSYHGWLLAYDATTLQQIAIFNATPNGSAGAIWQGGGGISADEAGYIYIVTANGLFDADKHGIDYGDSVVKLQLQSGQFTVVDYFTPYNQSVLEANDLDLGSSPALIFPDQSGPYPHLLATGGKDGRVWILNRDNLGQIQANDAGAVQVIPDGSDHLFGGGSYWNGHFYLQEVGDFLDQFPLQNGTAQTPSTSTFQIGYPDAPPAISSNGTSNAIVWLVKATGASSGAAAVLYAFDATDVASELYNSGQTPTDQAGPAVKFVFPTVANGKVYVGTAKEVDVYGLLP